MARPDINDALVRDLARLAGLPLDAADLTVQRGHLERLLGYVERLQAVDVSAVDPEGLRLGGALELRDDTPAPGLPRDALLESAPAHDGEHLLVPKVPNVAEDPDA